MATTGITVARISLRVFKATAKSFGLNYDRYDLVKYPSGWGLEKDGNHLLTRGYHTAKEWCFMINAAEAAMQAIINQKEEKSRKLISEIENQEADVIIIRSDVSAKVLDSAYNNGVAVKIKDDAGNLVVQLPVRYDE